ncbi:hypothetical protein JCM3770_001968 [Rhodotorula araucariae]
MAPSIPTMLYGTAWKGPRTAALVEQAVRQSLATSLKELKTDYLDALVLHSPMQTNQAHKEVWTEFERAVDEGKVRQLGISNIYDAMHLAWIFDTARIKPTIVQNRFYADVDYGADIISLCAEHGAVFQSFWTLTANPQLVTHPALRDSHSTKAGERVDEIKSGGAQVGLVRFTPRPGRFQTHARTMPGRPKVIPGRARSPADGPAPPPPGGSVRKMRVDPIGPPSDVLDPVAYVKRVEEALGKAAAKVTEIEAGWAAMGFEVGTQLKARSSVAGLLEENIKRYDSSWVRGDVHQWTSSRWIPPPPPPRRDQKPDHSEGDEQDDVEEPQPDSQGRSKTWSCTTLEGHPSLAEGIEAAETSSLTLLRLPQIAHFVRKTGLVDYNSLPALRPSVLNGPRPTHKDPLAHVLYTLTFHFLPRRGPTQSLSQQQTVVCLGTNTLEQLRKNLTIGGDNIPIEDDGYTEHDRAGGIGEDGSDEETGDGALLAHGAPLAGRFGGEERGAEQTRWRNERRETGCAFVAEGFIYADGDPDKADYAEEMLAAIEEIDWSSIAGMSPSPVTGHENADKDLLSLDPALAQAARFSAINAAAALPPLRAGAQGKPKLQAGASIQDAKLGEIPLRVGQPYLFVHQGNNEHLWTVDEVRYLHPTDPLPFPPPTANIRSNLFKHFLPPYPLTTFLARTASAGKCTLCEKEPGELVVIDDELSGETPAVRCRACFGILHPPPPDKRSLPEPAGNGGKGQKRMKTEQEAAPPQLADNERVGMDGVQVIPLLMER